MFGESLPDRVLIDLTERLEPLAMKPHEDKFLRNIQNNLTLSPKQRSWLLSILETHGVLAAPPAGRARPPQPPPPPPRETRLVGFPEPVLAGPPRRLGGIPAVATRSPTFEQALDEIDPCQGSLFGPGAFDPYEPDF